MSHGLSRRAFLQRTAATGAGVVLIGATEVLLTAPNALAAPAVGFGPLVATRPGASRCPTASATGSSPRRA